MYPDSSPTPAPMSAPLLLSTLVLEVKVCASFGIRDLDILLKKKKIINIVRYIRDGNAVDAGSCFVFGKEN